MRLPLILVLLAALLPVFFGKTRSAPFWLAVQGAALAWNNAVHHEAAGLHALASLAEIVVVRAVIAPLLLRRAIRRRSEPNIELMPSNLFTWVIGITLVVLAFNFGGAAMEDVPALALGVVGGMVALSLLLLSTNNAPPAQLVAVLFIENAIAVFESLLPEPWPWPVHAALAAVYLATVAVGCWLIGTPQAKAPALAPRAEGAAP